MRRPAASFANAPFADRLLATGSATFAHDANGSLAHRQPTAFSFDVNGVIVKG